MKLLGLALLMVASSAFAKTKGYDLKIDLSLKGKHVASPHLVVKEGEKATITPQSDNAARFIEVTATEGEVQGHKGILMNFTVGSITKDGKRTILSTPEILAKENESAQIVVGGKDGAELSMSVVAKRTAL